MAKYVIDETTLTGLADEVRKATGTTSKMKPSEMISAIPGIYEAGKQAEYDRLVDPTKIIKKTVSDSVIRVDDVSEIPHKCTVSVDNDASVTVCGKNLINPDVVAFPSKYWRRDGEVFVSDKDTYATYVYVELYLEAFKTYTFSVYIKPNAAGNYSLTARYNGAIVISNYPKEEGRYSISVTPTQNGVYRFTVGGVDHDSGMIVSQLQLEVGSTATAYEPYQGTSHAITAGQTIEVDSICPTMSITADNDTTITFGYHKSYGAQTEYDRFWDAYQDNDGNYNMAFANPGWTDELYNPKKPIICTKGEASNVFLDASITNTKQPIEIRVAQANNFFMGCSDLKTIPYIGFFGVTSTSSFFINCTELEDITVDGEIASGIGFAYCGKLTDASVQSIIDHLADLTGTTAKKITFHTDVLLRMTDEQIATITARNWTM